MTLYRSIYLSVFFLVTLYEKIHELEEKKQSLVDEANSKGTPAEEREKLLKQVPNVKDFSVLYFVETEVEGYM